MSNNRNSCNTTNKLIVDLLTCLEFQKSALIRLKNNLVETFGSSSKITRLRELRDFERIVEANRRSVEQSLLWCKSKEAENIQPKTLNDIEIKLIENFLLIKSLLRNIFDYILEFDVSDDSLADTVLIGSSDSDTDSLTTDEENFYFE